MEVTKRVLQVFVLGLLIVVLNGCANNSINYTYIPKMNNLLLQKDGNSIANVKFSTNSKYNNWISSCVLDSYTILDQNSSFGKLFVESVTLDSNCKWRGLALSSFESNLKRELKESYMQTVESIEKDNISFRTFKIDDSYLSLINIYDVNSEKFIIDYSGDLYVKLLSFYDKTYVDKFSSKKRFTKTYNDSLVRKNFIYRYFYREIERIDKP